MKHFHLFEQSLEDYRKKYGTFSDDFDQLIARVEDEMEEIRVRSKDKAAELSDYHVLRHEYETSMDNLSKMIQQLQNRTRQGNVKVNDNFHFFFGKFSIDL